MSLKDYKNLSGGGFSLTYSHLSNDVKFPVLADETLSLSPCHLPGLQAESRCGTITVMEDRASQSGRTLDLEVLVVFLECV